MNPLVTAACAAGLSQLLLALVLVVRLGTLDVRGWLFVGLLGASACHLLSPLLPGAAAYLSLLATAVPGLFWLFSSAVFDDRFRLSPVRWTPLGVTVLFPILGTLLGRPQSLHWLLFTLPQALEFLLVGLALWVVVQNWSTDLVESRRRLRIGFIGLSGTGVFVLILAREVLFPGAHWLADWQYVFVAGLLLGINVMLLGIRPGAILDVPPGPVPGPEPELSAGAAVRPAEQPVDEALVARIQDYMQAEKAWREMGLTIGALAERVGAPQYRLRHAINVGLGYRNVSDFLNSYRIRETAERLQDPAEAGLPVLTIAMDAGFRSLSSFNRAFKEAHGMTPTQYRKGSLAEKGAEKG